MILERTFPSTINQVELSRLPKYTLPASYELQPGSGDWCAGDPLGFPTYFTRAVYNQRGDSPRRGPTMLLFNRVVERAEWSAGRAKRDALMRRLWLPLPLDHPRTRCWIAKTYAHFRHCYRHPTEPDEYKQPGSRLLVIYPVPYYKLRTFRDDERFSDDWRAKERAAVDQANAETIAAARAVATPDNHAAVVNIRRYYPDYVPELELIDSPPQILQAEWWTTLDTAPATDDECKATCRTGIRTPHRDVDASGGKAWCRWCGYGAERVAEVAEVAEVAS